MKHTHTIIAALLLAVLMVMLSGCLPQTLEVQMPEGTAIESADNAQRIVLETTSSGDADRNTITVQANGEVKKMPDIAYITAGVQSTGKKMDAVGKDNREKMDAIMTALAQYGISEADIRTSYYNATPTYDWSSGTSKVTGYEVYNEVTITVKDIDKVGEVIDVCSAAGANISSNISFDYSDATGATNEAIELAVAAAIAKADVMAKAAGVQVKGIVSMSESTHYTDTMRNYYEPAAAAEPDAEEAIAYDTATTISSGDMTFSATVNVVIEIGE